MSENEDVTWRSCYIFLYGKKPNEIEERCFKEGLPNVRIERAMVMMERYERRRKQNNIRFNIVYPHLSASHNTFASGMDDGKIIAEKQAEKLNLKIFSKADETWR